MVHNRLLVVIGLFCLDVHDIHGDLQSSCGIASRILVDEKPISAHRGTFVGKRNGNGHLTHRFVTSDAIVIPNFENHLGLMTSTKTP
eukprot:scaffold39152_cov183-Amphora_coffeaeformis.AAC.1